MPELAPGITSLAFLLGKWAGEGHGSYPGIEPFVYREELEFSHTGKPFLLHSQLTWDLADERPLHTETGYWRAGPGNLIEAVIAHPTGVVEIEEGELDGPRLLLRSRAVSCTTTAKEVSMVSRNIEVDGDIMTYTLVMSAVGNGPEQHLAAHLRRT